MHAIEYFNKKLKKLGSKDTLDPQHQQNLARIRHVILLYNMLHVTHTIQENNAAVLSF